MGAVILMCSLCVIIVVCLSILLVPMVMESIKDLAKDFWAARIAWREGKERYMEYIKSHK